MDGGRLIDAELGAIKGQLRTLIDGRQAENTAFLRRIEAIETSLDGYRAVGEAGRRRVQVQVNQLMEAHSTQGRQVDAAVPPEGAAAAPQPLPSQPPQSPWPPQRPFYRSPVFWIVAAPTLLASIAISGWLVNAQANMATKHDLYGEVDQLNVSLSALLSQVDDLMHNVAADTAKISDHEGQIQRHGDQLERLGGQVQGIERTVSSTAKYNFLDLPIHVSANPEDFTMHTPDGAPAEIVRLPGRVGTMLGVPDSASSVWSPMLRSHKRFRVQAQMLCMPQGSMSESPTLYLAVDSLDAHGKHISHADVTRSGGPVHYVSANRSGFKLRSDDKAKTEGWDNGSVCDKKALGVFYDGNTDRAEPDEIIGNPTTQTCGYTIVTDDGFFEVTDPQIDRMLPELHKYMDVAVIQNIRDGGTNIYKTIAACDGKELAVDVLVDPEELRRGWSYARIGVFAECKTEGTCHRPRVLLTFMNITEVVSAIAA